MKKEQEGSTTKRRDFLRLAGASTVGGAAAAIGATGAEAKIEDERPGGYRETAHVKKVYELSRF